MSSHSTRDKAEFTPSDFKNSVSEILDEFRKLRKIKSFIIPEKRPSFCPEINDKSEKLILETLKEVKTQFKKDYELLETKKEEAKTKKRGTKDVNKHRKTGFSSPTYVEKSICELINDNVDDPKLRIQIKKTEEGELGVANRDLVNSFISWYVRKNKLNMKQPKVLFKLDKNLMKVFKPHIEHLSDQIKKKKDERGYTSEKCAKLELIDGEYWINYAALQIIITPLFKSSYHIPYVEPFYAQIDALRAIFAKEKKEETSDAKTETKRAKNKNESDSEDEDY